MAATLLGNEFEFRKIKMEGKEEDNQNGKKQAKHSHWGERERIALGLCVEQYNDIIESKETDSITLEQKKKAWQAVIDLWKLKCRNNDITIDQAKGIWKHMKGKSKTEEMNKRLAASKTGGGPPDEELSEECKIVMRADPKAFQQPPLNPFDSDRTVSQKGKADLDREDNR